MKSTRCDTIRSALSRPDPAVVQRTQRPGLQIVRTGTGLCSLFDLAVHPLPNENLESMLSRLRCALNEADATPLLQFVFGSLDDLREGEETMQRVFGDVCWPVNWIDGNSPVSGGIAGLQVIAVSTSNVARIRFKGRVVASLFEDGLARHCLAGGLGNSHPQTPKPEQAREAIGELETLLQQNGFSLGQLVRTWFYLDSILSWYGDFNKVRTTFYNKHVFRVGSLPASTGVCARLPGGAALALAAWAVQPLNGGAFPVQEIVSPLQCPAAAYGSSFSRAVEMNLPWGRRILISGTASIEPGGDTVWLGDIQRQIELSMEVVLAILKSRNMDFSDTARATAYFKNPDYAAAFADWRRRHEQELPPGILVHCDICRDDLLFEIELDAVKAG